MSYFQGSAYCPWQGLWTFDIEVRPENAVEAIERVGAHLDAVAADGLTDEELERARIGRGLRWSRSVELRSMGGRGEAGRPAAAGGAGAAGGVGWAASCVLDRAVANGVGVGASVVGSS